MESTDSSSITAAYPKLPPGFRFHPTDEELIIHYLKRKASSSPLPVSIIAGLDLYKFDPWELPSRAIFGENEWYFFSPRDRKYPNGARPNRAATSGYWKATGTDKPILTTSFNNNNGNNAKVGVKKALVFYGGKPARGIKTDWIMHEFRLIDSNMNHGLKPSHSYVPNSNKKASLRLDDWVLCRIYKKNNTQRATDNERGEILEELIKQQKYMKSLSSSSNTQQSMYLHHDPLYHNSIPMMYMNLHDGSEGTSNNNSFVSVLSQLPDDQTDNSNNNTNNSNNCFGLLADDQFQNNVF